MGLVAMDPPQVGTAPLAMDPLQAVLLLMGRRVCMALAAMARLGMARLRMAAKGARWWRGVSSSSKRRSRKPTAAAMVGLVT